MLLLFGDFTLDTDRRELRRSGRLIALQPQVFDVLEFVIRNRERVVSKDDLIAAVWGGRIISESALTTRINAVRSALGDTGNDQRFILCAAALGSALAPARAEVRILASPGGGVGPFVALFEALRESGERVVIDGPCLSACTLVLSLVPRRRICVTPRAALGFHAASTRDENGRTIWQPRASGLVLEAYPAPVRRWIHRRGGLSLRVLLLRGRELAKIYPRCG